MPCWFSVTTSNASPGWSVTRATSASPGHTWARNRLVSQPEAGRAEAGRDRPGRQRQREHPGGEHAGVAVVAGVDVVVVERVEVAGGGHVHDDLRARQSVDEHLALGDGRRGRRHPPAPLRRRRKPASWSGQRGCARCARRPTRSRRPGRRRRPVPSPPRRTPGARLAGPASPTCGPGAVGPSAPRRRRDGGATRGAARRGTRPPASRGRRARPRRGAAGAGTTGRSDRRPWRTSAGRPRPRSPPPGPPRPSGGAGRPRRSPGRTGGWRPPPPARRRARRVLRSHEHPAVDEHRPSRHVGRRVTGQEDHGAERGPRARRRGPRGSARRCRQRRRPASRGRGAGSCRWPPGRARAR